MTKRRSRFFLSYTLIRVITKLKGVHFFHSISTWDEKKRIFSLIIQRSTVSLLTQNLIQEFFWIEHCEQYSIFMRFNISCRQKIKFSIHFDKSFTTHTNIWSIFFPLYCYICYSIIYNVFFDMHMIIKFSLEKDFLVWNFG